MGADVNSFVDKIISDAEKRVRTDLKNVSSKIKQDFTDKAKEAVLMYYTNYSPRAYNRTYNLKENVIVTGFAELDEFKRYMGACDICFNLRIQFNSSNMSDYNIGNKDVVVSNFMYGIHGKRNIFVEGNPAINLMETFQENYKSILDGYFVSLGYKVS